MGSTVVYPNMSGDSEFEATVDAELVADFEKGLVAADDPRWPLRNYSEKLLQSAEARWTFLPPDRDRLAG